MTAAEAVASGVPVIVPDRGGAADFAAGGRGIRYRAADLGDCTRAILELPPAFAGNGGPGTGVRSMEEHFAELFGFYEAIRRGRTQRAA